MKIEIINIQGQNQAGFGLVFFQADYYLCRNFKSLNLIKHLHLATVAICMNITRVDENLGYMFSVWRK